jgi:hypothetical protein
VFKVEIYIPESKSRIYQRVLSVANGSGMYDQETGILTIVGIENLFKTWSVFSAVVWISQKWSGFFVAINDKPILPYSNDFYYQLQDLMYCYRARVDDSSEYCTAQTWGCRKLVSVIRYIGDQFYDAVPWYKYGKFADSSTWQVNRAAILKQLQSESEDNHCRNCPFFNAENVKQSVMNLPDRINIDSNFEIDYRVDYDQHGQAVFIPVNIRHRSQMEGLLRRVNPDQPEKPPQLDSGTAIDEYLDNLLKQRKRPK